MTMMMTAMMMTAMMTAMNPYSFIRLYENHNLISVMMMTTTMIMTAMMMMTPMNADMSHHYQ